MKKIFLTLILSIVIVALTIMTFKAYATQDNAKHLHAECTVNDSEHPCDEGLVCTSFNDVPENGKCEYVEFTPTATPSSTPTLIPTPTCEEDEDCQQVTPTPTDTPQDVCNNLVGYQEEVPANMQANSDHICICIDGFHQVFDQEYKGENQEQFMCEANEPTPTPKEPGQSGSSTDVVFVTEGSPGTCEVKIGRLSPANFHIYRNGSDVLTKWVPDLTQGSEVVIWYRNDDTNTDYSVIYPNDGYQTIHLYDSV